MDVGMHQDVERARILARALSRPIFTSLAKGEEPKRVFKSLVAAGVTTDFRTVGELFSGAYKALRSTYRNEYVYKSAIANRIVFGRHSPRTTALSVELPVGRSIVDVAVFNGTSTAYEIKTEFDSPRRLVTQTPDYLKAFDRVYVVTHPDLAQRYASSCDERVGILSLDSRDRLKTVREAARNIENVDPRAVFRMLRRDEYVSALEKKFGVKIDLPNGLIASHCEEVFSELNYDFAHYAFLSAMRKRTINEEVVGFLSALPECLRVLGYSSPLSKPQRQRALAALEMPCN
ncbi:hypothetical protein D9M70_388350 [compost metagenome]